MPKWKAKTVFVKSPVSRSMMSTILFLYLGTQLAGSRVKLVVERGSPLKTGTFASEVTLAKLYVPGGRIYSVCR